MFDRIVFLYVAADVVRKKACCCGKSFSVVETIAWEQQLALLEDVEVNLILVISLSRVPHCKPRVEESGLQQPFLR